MKVCYVTFRSITFAQRGQEVLRRGGISAALTRTPRQMEEQGCGYRLGIGGHRRDEAVALLQRAGISYSKIYCPEDGDGRDAP